MLTVLCVAVLFCSWQASVSKPVSGQEGPPPRPTVTPRPTATPIPTPTDVPTPAATSEPKKPKPPVAILLLEVQPVQSGLSSIVQWQDFQDDWHDVDGWRGTVVNGKTIWWVEEKDWGTGPFRWVVYEVESESVVAESTPFDLPANNSEPKVIQVMFNTTTAE
ncbi:MAG: hypothetical protein AAF702_28975 [Chloroflexota bacterium]